MEHKNRTFRMSAILLTALLLALLPSACGFHTFLPQGLTQAVDIHIPQDMLEDSRPTFQVNGRNFWEPLLDDVSHMELHEGYLRFIGTRAMPDGIIVPGSIDLYLGTNNDRLIARVIALDIPSVTIQDPLVVEINQEMSVEFRGLLHTYGSDVLFKEVQVTEEELHMKVQVTVRF
jgi:hypothetical protein